MKERINYMSNSSLVDIVIESPNCNSPRNNKIQKITSNMDSGTMWRMFC